MSLEGAGERLKEQLREDRHKKVVELLRRGGGTPWTTKKKIWFKNKILKP